MALVALVCSSTNALVSILLLQVLDDIREHNEVFKFFNYFFQNVTQNPRWPP